MFAHTGCSLVVKEKQQTNDNIIEGGIDNRRGLVIILQSAAFLYHGNGILWWGSVCLLTDNATKHILLLRVQKHGIKKII